MKTKEQKRHEAMLRARKVLPKHRARWMEYQPGGRVFERTKTQNPDYALQIQREAQIVFEEAAARAGTDLHGNPL